MGENIFLNGFQFEEYLNDKLLEIKELEHRKELKEVVKQIMLPFYEHVEEKYYELEKKFLEESEYDQDCYDIAIGVKKRDKIDLTDELFCPMMKEDMEECVIDTIKLRNKVNKQEPFYLYSVYMQLDFDKIQKLILSNRVFVAQIKTSEGIYSGQVCLKESKKYQKLVNELYAVFVRNVIPWKTVNMAYLYKFVDVMLIHAEIPEDETIIAIDVEFEEYSEWIQYQMVPVWNVSKVQVNDSGYPEFCLDQIHYKHMIYKNKLQEKCTYLIDNKEIDIWDIKKCNGDIEIVCDVKQDIKWNLIKIHEIDCQKNNGNFFWNKDLIKETKIIRTKAEIYNFIQKLGFEDVLRLVDVQIQRMDRSDKQGYDMNVSLDEGIHQLKEGYQLILFFEEVDNNFIMNIDILSYLVSRLQWEIPEYICRGRIIKKG